MVNFKLKIADLASYPPRECGIATYTQDLISAIAKLNSEKPKIIALNDNNNHYQYGSEVIFKIQDENVKDYQRAANFINQSDIQLVHIQHEFGLLGPKDYAATGSYILEFVKNLKKPFVITYHTVLSGPSAERVKVIKELADLAQANIVMVALGRKYLRDIYEVDPKKIKIIHHGVPDIGRLEPTKKFKPKLKLENKIVLATHGLINSGKGIEYVIRAIPKLIKKYPNLIYLVLGQTHPHIKKRDGEIYREKLEAEVKKFKIEKNVRFVNRYLTLDEIVDYLRATDIYLTPNLEPQQITSGILAYAVGAGRCCISTRYLYAKEILAGGKGILVDYKNPQDIAKKVDHLLSNPLKMKKMAQKTYLFGRQMTWSAVAKQHLRLYSKILAQKPIMEKLCTVKKTIISPALKVRRILNTLKD